MADSTTSKVYSLDGPLFNGARDLDGGTWIRIGNELDHRILLSAVKKALKNHEAAQGTVSALDEDAPSHIEYIKDSLERTKKAIVGALPAGNHQLNGTPIGKAIEQQLQLAETVDELAPNDVDIEDVSLLVALRDAGAEVEIVPDTWTKDDRVAAYRWARAIRLTKGGARRDLAVPPRPACVPMEWFTPEIKQALSAGELDQETLAPVILVPAQEEYWLEQGPWRIAEYSIDLTGDELKAMKERGEKAPSDGKKIEFAVEWSEAVEQGAEPPTHPFAYDSRDKARHAAALMNRRIRVDMPDEQDPVIQGEPLPLNEALLTVDLQQAVIKDLNDQFRASGDSKTIIDKATLDIGALRKWYRTGPYTIHRIEDAAKADGAHLTARYRVVKEMEPGRFVGTLSDYDIYEAHVRAAILNRAEFQTGQVWGGNEAAQAVEDGKKKKRDRKKGRGKGKG